MNGISENIKEQLIHPENYLPRGEKEYFASYFEKWRMKKSISDLWRDAVSARFPLLFRDGFYDKMREVSENDTDLFINLLKFIDSPLVLHDVLFSTLYCRDNADNILDVLKSAPPMVEFENNDNKVDNLFNDKIDSIIAPVALQILMWNPLQEDDRVNCSDSTEWDDSGDKLGQICSILSNRKDGIFLAYHYLKHLLRNEQKNSGYYDVLNAITEAFDVDDIFIDDGRMIVEGLNSDSSYVEQFKTTGLLHEEKIREGDYEGDVLLNYRAVLWFIGTEGYEQILYQTFERIYSSQAFQFFTGDVKFYLRHYDIARVLLAQQDPVKAWSEVMEMSSVAMQKISMQYFGNQGMNIRYHHAFMWNVGHRMLDVYCEHATESEGNLKSAKEMWGVLWGEGIQYVRRFAKYINESERDYIGSLFCYYYMCFIRDAADNAEDSRKSDVKGEGVKQPYDLSPLMAYFNKIKEFPIMCFAAMVMLDKNNLAWRSLFEYDSEFFSDIVHKAVLLAEGQFSYRWITDFLDKRRYVYDTLDGKG